MSELLISSFGLFREEGFGNICSLFIEILRLAKSPSLDFQISKHGKMEWKVIFIPRPGAWHSLPAFSHRSASGVSAFLTIDLCGFVTCSTQWSE